jgi:hypothetical protein
MRQRLASIESKSIRQRQRKDDGQHHLLMNEFIKNPDWDKSTITRLSQELSLKMSQIYKWNWDQQKKIRSWEGQSGVPTPSTSAEVFMSD